MKSLESGNQDKGPHKNKIYVSGILPGTLKDQIFTYFSYFGEIREILIDTDCNNQEFEFGHPKMNGRTESAKHYCVIVCRDIYAFNEILNYELHKLNGKRIFCYPHKSGKDLIKHNNKNNKKRAFIRKIPIIMPFDRFLMHVEREFGPIESFVNFTNDQYPSPKHYSVSITFENKEGRNMLVQAYEQGDISLNILGEFVLVDKFNRKKKNIQNLYPTSDRVDTYSTWTSQLKYPNTLRNKSTNIFLKGKKVNTMTVVDHSIHISSRYTCNRYSYAISAEELLGKPKPTCKDNYAKASQALLGCHNDSNLRINVLIGGLKCQLSK